MAKDIDTQDDSLEEEPRQLEVVLDYTDLVDDLVKSKGYEPKLFGELANVLFQECTLDVFREPWWEYMIEIRNEDWKDIKEMLGWSPSTISRRKSEYALDKTERKQWRATKIQENRETRSDKPPQKDVDYYPPTALDMFLSLAAFDINVEDVGFPPGMMAVRRGLLRSVEVIRIALFEGEASEELNSETIAILHPLYKSRPWFKGQTKHNKTLLRIAAKRVLRRAEDYLPGKAGAGWFAGLSSWDDGVADNAVKNLNALSKQWGRSWMVFCRYCEWKWSF